MCGLEKLQQQRLWVDLMEVFKIVKAIDGIWMHCQGSSGGGRFNCSNCLLQCVSERKEFARPWERDVRLAGVRQYGLGRPNNRLLLCNHSVTSVSITWKMQQFFFPCILLSSPHGPVRRDSSTLFASLWSFCYSWLLPLRVPFYFQTRYQVRETLLVSMWCSYPIQHCGIYWCVIEQNASM